MTDMATDASPQAGREQAPQAVLLDALGTLVQLEEPVPNLTAALGARGLEVAPGDVGAALRTEIAYYRAHHEVARDEAALEELRDRCAEVFRAALPDPVAAADPALVRAALLEGLRFRAFAEVHTVLRGLRERGARVVVVSNWDVSLHGVLRDTGLDGLVDGVLTSAEVGVAKPDPELFRRALALAGDVAPGAAVHVGDDPVSDGEGARAAGIPVVLLDRDGSLAGAAGGFRVAGSLAEALELDTWSSSPGAAR
jgi:putative hydrolase of the HAD superfamily